MKRISEFIIEKLKVSSKNSVSTPNTTITYLMFFNKIQKYCRSNGCKNFVPGLVDMKSRPEFLYEDNFRRNKGI